MAAGDYRKYRQENTDVSAQVRLNTTGSTTTLAASPASGSIFVQKLTVVPTTTGAVTWTINDATSGAITPVISMTGSSYSVDYGARGVQITTGAALQVVPSATGAAGLAEFEGYWKYMGGTSVGSFPASGASGSVP